MSDVFADTSYFVALLNPADRDHHHALSLTRSRRGRLVTTTWVMTEVANFLSKAATRTRFQPCLGDVRTDPMALLLPTDQSTWDQAVSLYLSRPDKDWSLTDCTSFIVMRRMRIKDALTADHHFQQAGFRALLLED